MNNRVDELRQKLRREIDAKVVAALQSESPRTSKDLASATGFPLSVLYESLKRLRASRVVEQNRPRRNHVCYRLNRPDPVA